MTADIPSTTDKGYTGITINSSTSGVNVTVAATKSEGYPLAYVLLCQRQATERSA